MHRFSFPFFAILLIFIHSVCLSAESTKAEEVLKNLWDALKENYPMMEYAGALDDSWYKEYQKRIEGVDDFQTAMNIINGLVDRLHDYHTSLNWEGRTWPAGAPLLIGYHQNKLVVIEDGTDTVIEKGDIVKTVDGEDALERFHVLMKTVKGATKYAKARSACGELMAGKLSSDVRVGLENAQGQAYEVTLERIGTLGYRNPENLSNRLIGKDIAYIAITGFGGFEEGDFDMKLSKYRTVPYLIIDVRNNGGGSDGLAERVIGRFIDKPVLCSISFQREAGTDMYKKLIATTDPRGPWQYTGDVAVLTDAGCASATEHFVSGMFEAGATLIGTPTTGACGWSKQIDLGHGVSLRCSLTFPMHGKVPSPLHGMEPHILAKPTIRDMRADRDTVLDTAIRFFHDIQEGRISSETPTGDVGYLHTEY